MKGLSLEIDKMVKFHEATTGIALWVFIHETTLKLIALHWKAL